MAVYQNGKLVSAGDGYPAVQKLNKKITEIRAISQAEYDALPKKDKYTLYIITA